MLQRQIYYNEDFKESVEQYIEQVKRALRETHSQKLRKCLHNAKRLLYETKSRLRLLNETIHSLTLLETFRDD